MACTICYKLLHLRSSNRYNPHSPHHTLAGRQITGQTYHGNIPGKYILEIYLEHNPRTPDPHHAFSQAPPMIGASYNRADRLMIGAPIKCVPGRTSPTTVGFKRNFGRVSVPGMADVMFNLRDWLVHKKSFHRPDRPSPLEVLAVPDLGDYLLSFLPRGEQVRVRQAVEMLLNPDVVIIPAFYVHTIPRVPSSPYLEADVHYAYINVDPDGFARLEMPERPEIWAHFKLPHAWSCLIFGQAYALMHELRSLRALKQSREPSQDECESEDDDFGQEDILQLLLPDVRVATAFNTSI